MTQVAEWLDHHHVEVVTIVGTAAILIVAAIIILVLSRLLQRWLSYLQGRLHLTDETNLTIGRIVVAVLWIFTALAVLNVWGVGLGGVWAVLVSAITVIGVGFLATWAMISNFTASFFLAPSAYSRQQKRTPFCGRTSSESGPRNAGLLARYPTVHCHAETRKSPRVTSRRTT